MHLLLALVEAQHAYTSAVGAGTAWIMPSSFGFEQPADFWWPIQDGVDLLEMWVRGVNDAGSVKGRTLSREFFFFLLALHVLPLLALR